MDNLPGDIIVRRCNMNDNHMMYGSWYMKHDRIFCHLDRFLPFYCPNNPKNQNFERLGKTSWDIIILHMCTINDNHVMYGSWDMEHDRQNFLSFWTFFWPFTPVTTRKTKNLKKWKRKAWRYYNFEQVYHKWQPHDILFLRYEVWRTELFVILDCFFPFTPLKTQKIKILKNWKKLLEISFYTSVPKIMIICYTVP